MTTLAPERQLAPDPLVAAVPPGGDDDECDLCSRRPVGPDEKLYRVLDMVLCAWCVVRLAEQVQARQMSKIAEWLAEQ